MPKRGKRKGLCNRKGQRKKEPEEQKMVDCAEPKINKSTPDESGKTAGDMRSCTSKDIKASCKGV